MQNDGKRLGHGKMTPYFLFGNMWGDEPPNGKIMTQAPSDHCQDPHEMDELTGIMVSKRNYPLVNVYIAFNITMLNGKINYK